MTKKQFWAIAYIISILFLIFFGVGYVLLLFYVLIALIQTAFPTWLSGQIEGNYFRNGFELAFFAASSVFSLVAIYAIKFARQQSKEAENSRLASIYTAIEARWSGGDIKVSRIHFHDLINEYRKTGKPLDSVEFPAFISAKLHKMSISDPKKYIETISIIDFLEYLGMLETKKYLRIADLEPLIGEVVIQYDNFVGHYIQELGAVYQTQAQNQNLTKMPATYEQFTTLAKKFRARFS
jgi:hypothetical protein